MRQVKHARWIVALAAMASMIAPASLVQLGSSATAGANTPAADTVQYLQSSSATTSVKYTPGNGSAATTQSYPGSGPCATPTPSGAPILSLSAFKYTSPAYTDTSPAPAVVSASHGRTGLCGSWYNWYNSAQIQPGQALDFAPGTSALTAGRPFIEAKIALASSGYDGDNDGDDATTVRLVEFSGATQVCTYTSGSVTKGTGPACTTASVSSASTGTLVDTGVVAAGFSRVEVQVLGVSGPTDHGESGNCTGVSVIGPASTFSLGSYSLALTKTDSLNGTATPTYSTVGQSIGYTLVATNSGLSTLHNVTVSDSPALAGFACTQPLPVASLASGATVTCTGTHVVTQADIDAGHLTDTGSASATEAAAPNATDTVNASQNPQVALTNTSPDTSYSTAGQVLTYNLVATNTGNVTLSGVSISDPGVSGLACTPTQPATLAPGATLSCTGTHTVSQTDLDTGTITNTATVTGTPPAGGVTSTATATATKVVSATQTPHVSLSKTVTEATYDAPGQTLHYQLVATNDGNVTLSGVSISDSKVSGLSCNTAQPAVLTPQATLSCTGTYTTTQTDVDGGTVTNSASVSGTPPSGGAVTGTATATSTAVQTPGIALVKSATTNDANNSTYTAPGEVITYGFMVTNTGNTTLSTIALSDPFLGPGFAVTCPAPLAPGASETCTGAGNTYTVGQTDLDNGSVTNTATATATAPGGSPSASSTVTVSATQNAQLSLVKTDSLNGAHFTAPGQVITYTVTATNSGNITLTNVNVADSPTPDGFSCTPTVPAATLAPGASVSCTGSHTVTLADLGAGSLTDTATATSDQASATPVSDTVTAFVQKVCTGQTLTDSSTSVSTGTVTANLTIGILPTADKCKTYNYFAATAGSGPDGSTIDFISQPLAGAHVTASFDWGYEPYCVPNATAGSTTPACAVTYVDFGDGTGPHAQTFCSSADPANPAVPWCTTGRTYQYVQVPDPANPGQTILETHITETWDGYGDITFKHH